MGRENTYSVGFRRKILPQQLKKLKTELRGLGPRANYADRATAACWRSSANPRGEWVWRGQRSGLPRSPVSVFWTGAATLFLQVAPQLSSPGWVDPVPDPPLLRKSRSVGNQTQDLWICSQKLWPLDYRGGHNLNHWTHVSQYNYSYINIWGQALSMGDNILRTLYNLLITTCLAEGIINEIRLWRTHPLQ
jgi:hypothetical protein